MFGLIAVIITIILIILSILFFPTIKIFGKKFSTYWMIALIGAIILLISKSLSIEQLGKVFTADTMNPLKILVLFISMTILSIFLDEIGMFRYIAIKAARKFKTSQFKLFYGFYFLISLLTIFTSNDIIILTFTPFICYYCKNAKINPIPYLVGEFVAANTWSMFLIIGNPTNIFIASTFNIDFVQYLIKMAIPTLLASITSLLLLSLIFVKSLKKAMDPIDEELPSIDKVLLIVGVVHLIACTILIAISSYIGIEMWYVTLAFALSLLLITTIYNLLKKKPMLPTLNTLKRAPWALIPFVISMFIIVETLNENGVVKAISDALPDNVFAYGFSSLLAANLINNIPMSVLFSNIMINSASLNTIYATIISSNIAAIITPIGALAGIMWMSLLKTYEVKFSFVKFICYGLIIGIPTLAVALSALLIL